MEAALGGRVPVKGGTERVCRDHQENGDGAARSLGRQRRTRLSSETELRCCLDSHMSGPFHSALDGLQDLGESFRFVELGGTCISQKSLLINCVCDRKGSGTLQGQDTSLYSWHVMQSGCRHPDTYAAGSSRSDQISSLVKRVIWGGRL